MRIDQWVPALHRGDAIGDSARLMRDAFRSWGHAADVYALELDAELEGDGRRFADWRPGGSRRRADPALRAALAAEPRRSASTAAGACCSTTTSRRREFFEGWDDELVRICRIGREELEELAPHCDLGLADSEFNRLELEALGVARTGVLPICLDFDRYRAPASPVLRRMLDDGATNLLFVGRLAPNKRPDDLIRLASYWRRFLSQDVRLVLVGKLPRRGPYFDALQALAYEEGFTPSEVMFLGHVAHDELARLLPGRARVRVDERARGLRRAARRVDADATCRCWPTRRRRCRTRSAARACGSPRSDWRRWRSSPTRSRRTRRCARRCWRARTEARGLRPGARARLAAPYLESL